MVRVPVRAVVAVFAATRKPVAPEPDPAAPLVIVIHAALLVALQAQPDPAVTTLPPVPPAAVKDCVAGEMP